MTPLPARRMILGGGLQSGGTTLISWCFLQRSDTDGVLDMHASEDFRITFDRVNTPYLWVKMTIHVFRLLDLAETYADLGWQVSPLLVVRDVRSAYSSLLTKPYGHNGNTADEPPLRLRFRRFLRDWYTAREHGWPILRYEDVVTNPRAALVEICAELGMPWDEGMLQWRKPIDAIAYVAETNATFTATFGTRSLDGAVLPDKARINCRDLPLSELDWLEDVFAEYNQDLGYPLHVDRSGLAKNPPVLPPPQFDGSVRQWWVQENERLWAEIMRLQEENRQLRNLLGSGLPA